jgi:hypothetical protein
MIAIRRPTLTVCAIAGFAACGIGLLLDAKTMLASYLTVWTAMSAIPIGALGVLMMAYLVRGGWTEDFHEPLSSAALTMPVLAALFVPVVLGLDQIYPWASGTTPLPDFKAAYLVPWFFMLRAAIYFVVLTVVALWTTRAYGDDVAMTRAASGGLAVWALVASFAGIDWMESVEPEFHSSIYGLLALSFDLLGGLAFGVFAVLASPRPQRMRTGAYSGVLLSMLLLWAYLHAMQYIIIWAGNLPEEVVWYLTRLRGGWGYALWLLCIAQFVVPFFALLSERVRRNPNALRWIVGATLALRLLETAVLILPPLDVASPLLALDVPAAVVAIGASWTLAWRAAGPLWRRWSGRAAAAH